MRPHILHNGLHRIGDQRNHFIDSERFLGRDPFDDNRISSTPPANVAQNQAHYDLEIALPGFDKAEISLSVQDRALLLTAQKKEDLRTTDLVQQEFTISSLQRTFHMPDSVDTSGIQASLRQGILYVRLPYERKAPSQHIAIY